MSPSQILQFLLQLYIWIVLMRFLLQCVRADFYNPLSQFVVRMTQPVLGPLRKIIPSRGRIDAASLVFAALLTLLPSLILMLMGRPVSVLGMLHGALWTLSFQFLDLIFWCVIIRALLSWVDPYGQQPVTRVLGQISEPMLKPIRRVLPSTGGLDLSPMLLILLIWLVQWFLRSLLSGSFQL